MEESGSPEGEELKKTEGLAREPKTDGQGWGVER